MAVPTLPFTLGRPDKADNAKIKQSLQTLLDAITDGEGDLSVDTITLAGALTAASAALSGNLTAVNVELSGVLTIDAASGNPTITFEAAGTARSNLFPISGVEFVLQPVSSNQSYLYIVPKGTNTSGQYIFSTDYQADTSNWEALVFSKTASGDATINVNKGGTGGYRNLDFKTNNTLQLTINTSGNIIMNTGQLVLKSFTVTTLPTGVTGGMIYVTNEAGGAVPAFFDGTNWRRVTDRAVIS